jgi:hypothetical protein
MPACFPWGLAEYILDYTHADPSVHSRGTGLPHAMVGHYIQVMYPVHGGTALLPLCWLLFQMHAWSWMVDRRFQAMGTGVMRSYSAATNRRGSGLSETAAGGNASSGYACERPSMTRCVMGNHIASSPSQVHDHIGT